LNSYIATDCTNNDDNEDGVKDKIRVHFYTKQNVINNYQGNEDKYPRNISLGRRRKCEFLLAFYAH
jgi:hypothetical protein